MMKRIYVILSLCTAVISLQSASAESLRVQRDSSVMTWSRTLVDGSRTGVTVPSAGDPEKALGRVSGRRYYSPSGRVFRGGSVPKVARTVIDAQPAMAPVKRVIGYSPESMAAEYPESALSNWFADNLIRAAEDIFGTEVDMSIANFGGIRTDMPEGDVTVDDIRSMFPFKNDLVYLKLRGADVRNILEWMAENGFQVLGGVRIVAGDGKLVSAEIGGKPLDDNALYGVATISFLLDGGDGLYLGRNAVEKIDRKVEIYDAVMDIIEKETASGRQITGCKDGRVVIEE